MTEQVEAELEPEERSREGAGVRPPALVLEGVTKEFRVGSGDRVIAVDNVSLSIDDGEFVCVLGPSGHGKSTLLSLIAGFVEPTSGRVLCHGEPVSCPGADRGVIFQRDTVFLWKRVAENVGFGLKARGVPKEERDQLVARLLDVVGLTRFARAWPKQLSGGMRRRVTIATVFANRPAILLMDEAFTGLDYARRATLHRVLVDLWREVRNTVFFVTHDLEEALALATRVIVILDGGVVYDARVPGSPPRAAEALSTTELNQMRAIVLEQLQNAVARVDDGV